MPWQDKKVWIIGGTHGIGKAVADNLTGKGATVIASGRSAEKYALDVCDYSSVEKARDEILRDHGMLDLVIFCSGIYEPMHVYDLKRESALNTINVNLIGCMNCVAAIVPVFLRQGRGHYANTASVAGYFGLANSFAYGASKAAIINLTETMAIELRPKNIKVQLICPGFVKSRLTDKNDFEMPFIMEPEAAAQRIVKGLESSRFEIHFPYRLSVTMKLIGLLPRRLKLKILDKVT